MKRMFKNAFTLIELLVVITIIGIISGLLVVGMSSLTTSANVAKAEIFSNSLRNSYGINMVSDWTFDGMGIADTQPADNSYAYDIWGDNDGIVGSSPTVYSGSNCVYGSCLKFSGAAFVNVGSNSSLNTNTSVTVGLWVKTNNVSPPGWINFINTNANGNCDSGSYCLRWNGGSIYAHFYNTVPASSIVTFSQTLINDNKWHYLTASYDGAITAIYLDGQKRATGTLASPLRNIPTNIHIGNPTGSYTETIDEVRIFNVGISSSQIKEIYYAGLQKLLAKGTLSINDYNKRLSNI